MNLDEAYSKFLNLLTQIEHYNVQLIGNSVKVKSIAVGSAITHVLQLDGDTLPTPEEYQKIKSEIPIIKSYLLTLEKDLAEVEKQIETILNTKIKTGVEKIQPQ